MCVSSDAVCVFECRVIVCVRVDALGVKVGVLCVEQ